MCIRDRDVTVVSVGWVEVVEVEDEVVGASVVDDVPSMSELHAAAMIDSAATRAAQRSTFIRLVGERRIGLPGDFQDEPDGGISSGGNAYSRVLGHNDRWGGVCSRDRVSVGVHECTCRR